jgi:hypothetical protein
MEKHKIYKQDYKDSKAMYSYQTVTGEDPKAQRTTGFMSAPMGRA